MTVAVVTNPRSRHNRNNPQLQPALAYVLGERGELVSPSDLGALAQTVRRFRDRGTEVLCVNGGDGTLHQVITAAARVWGDAPMPALALLRGGTMNIVADSVGVRVDAETMLGRVVEAIHTGDPLPTVTRRLLRVEVDDQPPFFGFLSGNGIIARFLELYYERPDPTPLSAGWLLARGAMSALVGGPLIRRLTRPYSGRVEVDGVDLGGDRWVAVALGSIEQMGLGFQVFPRAAEDPDRFQFVAMGGSVSDVARELPSLYRGRGVRRPENRSNLAAQLVFRSDEPIQLMIDGDFYVAARGRVRYTVGPSVRFLLPTRAAA
ncbi:MAG: diacylglycerol kinase family protein [Myxococcota bacterium]